MYKVDVECSRCGAKKVTASYGPEEVVAKERCPYCFERYKVASTLGRASKTKGVSKIMTTKYDERVRGINGKREIW